jgi:catechol 2,3-dioxygenase-like lactoylglutathione lyase family enzyme
MPSIFKPKPNAAIVRYLVGDVDRALAFYTGHLGFELVARPAPIIAIASRGDLHLMISGRETSGARAMPDGRVQEPGGWNRIIVYVDDLEATIARLRDGGATFRNQIESGPGGRQILVDDPDGNPVELHEAPRER